MGLLSLLQHNPIAFFIIAAALMFSLTIHEFAHAYAADRLGDSTPRRLGRVTLNPLNHLDPIGSLLILIVGFGWARPVPVNFDQLSRWGGAMVAAAGPLSNILIALICVVLLKVLSVGASFEMVLYTVLSINLLLAIFNMIPIPMFDGSRIVGALIPSLGKSLRDFEMMPLAPLIVMGFVILMQSQIGVLIRSIRNWVLHLFNI